MAEEIYYCESCGGIMEFDIKSQQLKCPNCGNEAVIRGENDSIIEHTLNSSALKRIRPEEKETVTMVCTGCGAPIELEKNATATKCPYCGSSYVMAKKQEEVIVPDGVVTFKITNQEAKHLFREWIKKKYLAPGELKHLYQRGSFMGVYIPYWTFDADTRASYTAMGGRNRTVRYKDSSGNERTKTVTDWYYTNGRVNRFFDDVLICAADRDDKSLIEGIDSFDTKNNMKPYSPDYISGYLAESFSVNLETGHQKAVNRMMSELRSMASNEVLSRYDRVKDVRVDASFDKESFKYVLVPVYTANYSYKNKNYTVLINGENGAIKGQYPKSIAKIIALIIAAAIAAGVVLGCFGDSDSYGSTTGRYEYAKEYGYEYTQYTNNIDYDGDI